MDEQETMDAELGIEEDPGVEETQAEESAPQNPEEDQDQKTEDEGDQDPDRDQQKGIQKRFNKLTAEKYQYKNRADQLEREIQELKQSQAGAPGKPPRLEDFDYDEEAYGKAVREQEYEAFYRRKREAELKAKKKEETERSNLEFARKVEAANIEGYHEAMDNLIRSVPLPFELVRAIQADEKGPELVYHLGNNLDLADTLARLEPVIAAKELGKISAGLSAEKTAKKITNARPPVKPAVSGGGQTGKKLEKMSMEEIMADDNI